MHESTGENNHNLKREKKLNLKKKILIILDVINQQIFQDQFSKEDNKSSDSQYICNKANIICKPHLRTSLKVNMDFLNSSFQFINNIYLYKLFMHFIFEQFDFLLNSLFMITIYSVMYCLIF